MGDSTFNETTAISWLQSQVAVLESTVRDLQAKLGVKSANYTNLYNTCRHLGGTIRLLHKDNQDAHAAVAACDGMTQAEVERLRLENETLRGLADKYREMAEEYADGWASSIVRYRSEGFDAYKEMTSDVLESEMQRADISPEQMKAFIQDLELSSK